MKVTWPFWVAVLLTLGCGAVVALHLSMWYALGGLALLLVMLYFLYRKMVKPVSSMVKGMDLVKAQDFASRLSTVGQADADTLVHLFNDMMDRLKRERLRVQEQNSFLHLLIEASPLAIAICDYDGRLVELNQVMASLLGVKRDVDWRGRQIGDVDSSVARAIARIAPGSAEVVKMEDAQSYRCSRLWFVESGFRRPFIMMEPMTEELRRAERKGYEKVIRTMAHEVNNSMGGVITLLDALVAVSGADAEVVEALTGCRDRCSSMSGFISRYAEVVKLPEPTLAPMNIDDLVIGCQAFLESLLPQGVRLEIHHADHPLRIRGDKVLLEQVLVNMVKNSAESLASKGEGLISITIHPRERQLIVADNGAGIDEATAQQLFSPFFSTKQGGQGIGLMMISETLRRHGCRFSLATSATDHLTRFTILFPN
ncbi:MAG: PAS domain-containing protein [Bacteroidales bacterium]|nr:PAS domain-containing protein [Bacteroidales bacterium]